MIAWRPKGINYFPIVYFRCPNCDFIKLTNSHYFYCHFLKIRTFLKIPMDYEVKWHVSFNFRNSKSFGNIID